MLSSKRSIILISVLGLLALACNFSGLIDRIDLPGGIDLEGEEEIAVEIGDQEQESNSEAEEETPKPGPGETFDNPAPVGVEVVADNKAFVVLSATRPADAIVAEANSFNESAGDGEEYLFVELQINCQKPEGDQCEFMPFNMLVYGSLEENQPRAFVAGIDYEINSVEFNASQTVSGVIPFLVGQGETDLVLVYQPFSGGAYFFTVPE